ncbi:hypothetical protein [Sphingosinicella sp. CPCC 101087]|uniref:hypothetical protein n=1 Tax=Sphingosinicella sp. CPCC 101087 TaxID=2497754 RepID=UPI00101B8778|nr:hypothetical protein [Sphingosinicella sp. CPCC 101087]
MATTGGRAGAGRFRIERDVRGECVVIPARRPLVLLFLLVWLTIWTGGGIAGFVSLFGLEADIVGIAAGGWLFAGLVGSLLVAWQLTGQEVIRVRGGEVEAAHSVLGRTRRRSWPIAEIGRPEVGDPIPLHRKRHIDLPFLFRPSTGAVKFIHAGKTVRLAQGLSLDDGRRIVEWLEGQLGKWC